MESGLVRLENKAGTEERTELKGPGIELEALTSWLWIYQQSSDIRTRAQLGNNYFRCGDTALPVSSKDVLGGPQQTGRQAPLPLWLD
jgi:hypothetical protein